MDRVRYLTLSLDRRRSVIAEHCSIVDAMAERDAEGAERALRVHLGDLRNALARIRKAHSAYFEGGE
jgi:DNA-binding GntR family transcriptional regulator